jgi:aromatic-L-amino-acid/L-tryptophan decarboxylase
MRGTQASSNRIFFDEGRRESLWKTLSATIESYLQTVQTLPVAPALNGSRTRARAESYTFEKPLEPEEAIRTVAQALIDEQVHTSHPRYFGLFNPASTVMSIAADALVATLNPQLAAWSHSPLAVEMERHLVLSIAEKFGLSRDRADGVFTTGGAEANQTALLAALTHRWPEVASHGLRGLAEQPVFYVSAEGHHSFLKAARASGLGAEALREVEVAADLRMDPESLRGAIQRDRSKGLEPFLVVATAGTTGAGVIDPLDEIAGIARENAMWFHVDAAWGGAAALVPELRPVLAGIEMADSITFDAHKFLSIAMGAGIFITPHSEILGRCFATMTSYMPKEGEHLQVEDPFAHSLQWSRRFIGLKLFLSLSAAGWDGYAQVLRNQCAMGKTLREKLTKSRWNVVNETPLPLVCFANAQEDWDLTACQQAANQVAASGAAWISTIQLGANKRPALRACITSYRTGERDLDRLVTLLDAVRENLYRS